MFWILTQIDEFYQELRAMVQPRDRVPESVSEAATSRPGGTGCRIALNLVLTAPVGHNVG